MDDECVEELGRPISSLKVSELRDELAKRALIKTGKKNELIDRLRQAISKQPNVLQSSSNFPAVLTVQQGVQAHAESAIDYSTHQNANSDMTSSPKLEQSVQEHNQNLQEKLSSEQPIAVVNREEMPSHDRPPNEKPLEENLLDENPIDDKPSDEVSLEKKPSEEKPPEEKPSEEKPSDVKSLEKESLDRKPIDEQPKDEQPADKKPLDEKPPDGPDHIANSNSKMEPEPAVPMAFTLKRGNRDGTSSNRADKRRKWSGRSESIQSNDSSLVPSGISSQKLQELIDSKKTESKSIDAKSSQSTDLPDTTTEKTQTKKNQSTDNAGKKVVETPEAVSEAKQDAVKQTVENDANNDSIKHDEKLEAKHESSEEQKPEQEPTRWLMIRNLMRPFTVGQLKEELTKCGLIDEEKFWTDKVKSKCCVLYSTIEAAQETKQSMHGQHWPAHNPKSLVVNFITEDEYNMHVAADAKPPAPAVTKKSENVNKKTSNGNLDKTNEQSNNRLADRLEVNEAGASSIQKRLGGKLGGDAANSKPGIDLSELQTPKELDEFFRKTKAKPQLFWLPLNDEQADARAAERQERDKRAQELALQNASRRSPPAKRRPTNLDRRSPPPKNRSPTRRSPIRRRSPVRRRTPLLPSRRSPPRRRAPPSPLDSSPPRRRSPPRDHSPILRRRISPRVSPPPMRRRTPPRDSPLPRRRTPIRDSPPPMRRRSPSPLLRRRTPPRDSPPIRRRSPEPGRRSPGVYNRRSPPDAFRRSPGQVRRMSPGRRSPAMIRRSPGMMRRSPGLTRRSPGLARRSPGPIRRSPGPMRRARGGRDYD